MVYVTHDQLEAMTMADTIVVMRDGYVEQVGPPLELYESPANIFAAGFIGSPAMNFIAGRFARESGHGYFRAAEATLPLPDGSDCPDGAPVVLGIRPEHLAVGRSGHGVPAVAEVVEPTGATTYVTTLIDAQPVTAIYGERATLTSGEPISLIPAPDRLLLFDKDSGKRLAFG